MENKILEVLAYRRLTENKHMTAPLAMELCKQKENQYEALEAQERKNKVFTFFHIHKMTCQKISFYLCEKIQILAIKNLKILEPKKFDYFIFKFSNFFKFKICMIQTYR